MYIKIWPEESGIEQWSRFQVSDSFSCYSIVLVVCSSVCFIGIKVIGRIISAVCKLEGLVRGKRSTIDVPRWHSFFFIFPILLQGAPSFVSVCKCWITSTVPHLSTDCHRLATLFVVWYQTLLSMGQWQQQQLRFWHQWYHLATHFEGCFAFPSV